MFGTDVGVEIVLIVGLIGTFIALELSLLRMISSEVFSKVDLTGRVVLTLCTLVTSPGRHFLLLPFTLIMISALITEITLAT